MALAAIVYILWVSLTFKRHGFVGGWKNITGYDTSIGPALPFVMLIEFMSNLLIRPFTHAVRLFANMFAGHVLLLMFTIASWYLLNGIGIAYAGVSFVMTIVMTAFELFIQAAAGVRVRPSGLQLHSGRSRRAPLSSPAPPPDSRPVANPHRF